MDAGTPAPRLLPIAELRPGMKSVSCQFIVLEKAGQPTKTRDNNVVHQVLVADGTAAITLSLWDELGELVDSGDILRLTNGWASLHKGALHLYAGNKGKVKRVGQYNMVFTEVPNMSHYQWQPDPNNPDVPIMVAPPGVTSAGSPTSSRTLPPTGLHHAHGTSHQGRPPPAKVARSAGGPIPLHGLAPAASLVPVASADGRKRKAVGDHPQG